MAAAAATFPIRSESPFYDDDDDQVDLDSQHHYPSSYPFPVDAAIPLRTPVLSRPAPPSSTSSDHASTQKQRQEYQQQQQQQQAGVLQLRERRHVRPLLAVLARVHAATGYPVEGVPAAASMTDDQLLALLSGTTADAVGAGLGGRPRGEVAGLVVMMPVVDACDARVHERRAAAGSGNGSAGGGADSDSDPAAMTTTMMTPVGHLSVQTVAEHGDRTPTRLWMEWNWKRRGWGSGVGGDRDRRDVESFAEAAELLANTWMLAKLFVDPRAWGRRYGELLVAAAEEMATAAGKWLVLIVIEKDKAAIRLYEKRGWVKFAVAEHQDPTGKVWIQSCYVAPRSGNAANTGDDLSPTGCHEILQQHGRWYTSAK